jgi:hypothetical protein
LCRRHMEEICLFHELSVRGSSLTDFMLWLNSRCSVTSSVRGTYLFAVVLVIYIAHSAAFNVSDLRKLQSCIWLNTFSTRVTLVVLVTHLSSMTSTFKKKPALRSSNSTLSPFPPSYMIMSPFPHVILWDPPDSPICISWGYLRGLKGMRQP